MPSTTNKKINTATPDGQLPPAIMQQLKIARKFEIFVEEFDEEHEPGTWRPVKIDSALGGNGSNPVITVSSPTELQEKQQLYRSMGQRFRILREIDPPSQSDLIQLAREQGFLNDNKIKNDDNQQDISSTVNSTPVQVSSDQNFLPQQIQRQDDYVPINTLIKPKSRIVTIGDMQIKYDGDKIYQKQWCQVTPVEAKNIRIVNDSNNKIASLSGKHIEVRRWVLVEEQYDESPDIEGILNG